MADVTNTLVYLFQQCFSIPNRIFSETNTWGIVISAFFVFTLYRFLLAPFLGAFIASGASDKVRKIRGKNKVQAKKTNKNSKKGN